MSVFFMQSASFLAHQQAMQDKRQRNNANSLFGIEMIPNDPQIRNLHQSRDSAHLLSPCSCRAIRTMVPYQAAMSASMSSIGPWVIVGRVSRLQFMPLL